jgi:hypothetical protein
LAILSGLTDLIALCIRPKGTGGEIFYSRLPELELLSAIFGGVELRLEEDKFFS